MNRVDVCYHKKTGKLNIISRSGTGDIKMLDDNYNFYLVSLKDYVQYKVFSSFYAKTRKDKLSLERDLIDDIQNISKYELCRIQEYVVEKVKAGKLYKEEILSDFKVHSKNSLVCKLNDFNNSGNTHVIYDTPFNRLEFFK